MKKMMTVILVLSASLSASAAFTNDAILGPNDTFACDSFASNAKVVCIPNTQSSYNGRTSFPSAPPIILAPYQVIECRNVGGQRDVICNSGIMPGGPMGPGGPQMPPQQIVRAASGYPDYNCLATLPQANNADDMVSNAFIPSTNRIIDRCEQNRDLHEVRDMQSRGFSCVVDTLATNNQGNLSCVQGILSKITNQATIKGSHRDRIAREYCATKTYKCTRTGP